jgi:small-conductance mechanosensitive channel
MAFAITARLLSMLIIGGLIIYGIYRLIKPSSMDHSEQSHTTTVLTTLRNAYFYATSFIGLIMLELRQASLPS